MVDLKPLAFLLALAPLSAQASPTVFDGPQVPIAEAAVDFPRFDIDALCTAAWPGKAATSEAARNACKTRQARLAGITSMNWVGLRSAAAKQNCAKRSAVAYYPYAVLYACVNAELLTQADVQKARLVSERIRAQNGGGGVDREAVGSIR